LKQAYKKRAGPEKSSLAFTLIELLVVMGIIAILSALLMPALSSAKRKATQVNCTSNIKQLTLANYTHSDDYGEHLDYGNLEKGTNQQEGGYWNEKGVWMGALISENQNQNEKIFACPAARLKGKPKVGEDKQGSADTAWVRWSAENDPKARMYSGSYGYNGWLYTAGLKDGMFVGSEKLFYLQSQNIDTPSKTPVFFDSVWVDAWPMENDLPARDLYAGRSYWERTNEMGRLTIGRHGNISPAKAPRDFNPAGVMPGAINIGMSDGHAEKVKLEDLWNLRWHKNWQTPATRPR